MVTRQFGAPSCMGRVIDLMRMHPHHIDRAYVVFYGEPAAPASSLTIVQPGSEISIPPAAPAVHIAAYEIEHGRIRFFLGDRDVTPTLWIDDPDDAETLVVQILGRRPGANDLDRAAAAATAADASAGPGHEYG
jgi:hypothetical protein